jgi:hypothetical protein
MARPVAGPLGRWSGYGLGLARLATRCGEAVGHTGTVDGYVTVAYALPRARRSVVLMLSTDRDPFGDLVTDVVETGLCG